MTHPNFNISFTHKASTLLLAELEQDKIDICISYQSLLDQNHKCFLIGDEQLILVTGILDTPYLDGITREELLSLPLFGSDICLVNRELVDWHDSTFPKDQNFSIHTSVTWDLVYLIRQGAGYAFLPRSFVAHDLEDHSLIEIPLLFSPPPRICTYLVIKNQHFGDLKLQEFLSDLKEHLHILHSSPAQM